VLLSFYLKLQKSPIPSLRRLKALLGDFHLPALFTQSQGRREKFRTRGPGAAPVQNEWGEGVKRKIETYSYNFRGLPRTKCSLLFSTPKAWRTPL